MPSIKKIRNALLADRVDKVAGWLGDGLDPNVAIDERGATPLFYACTAVMARSLLDGGADPLHALPDGTSTLDSAAVEGQLDMVRELLRAAPQLASEARALLAADQPETEALIRAIARGDRVDTVVADPTPRLAYRRVRPAPYDRAPSRKGAQRFYGLPWPGVLAPEAVPDWAAPHLGTDSTVCAAEAGRVLVFTDGEPPLLVGEDGAVDLAVPPVPWPYEYAMDAGARHIFFGYGQARIIGVARDEGTTSRVVDLELPGAGWGTVLVKTAGESPRGHTYPARLAVVGNWLVAVSLERIHAIPFGDLAEPAKWWTCQMGTCVTPVRGGRIVIVGARAGGVVLGVRGRRLVRLADLVCPAAEQSPLHGHLRMALRVSGEALDDPRYLQVFPEDGSTTVMIAGLAGMDARGVTIKGLTVDPAELETPTTRTEIVDAYEFGGEVHLRVSPIGHGDVATYAVDGLDALWDAAFAVRAVPPPSTGDGLVAVRVPLPDPYPPPHPDVGTLSYPETGPTGYAFGMRVSKRPGFWSSYVVNRTGARQLQPPWYSGVTYRGFHATGPRMAAASGREVIDINMKNRSWRRAEFDRPVRGVCYFESGLAVLLHDELLLLPALDAEPTMRVPTTTRNSEMASFFDQRILWVPAGADRNVFLARRDGHLVVVGVLVAEVSGTHQSPDGDFLAVNAGAAQLLNWESALRAAVEWTGTPLHECTTPVIELPA